MNIKDILKRVEDYLTQIRSSWLLLVLMTSIFGGLFFLNSILKPPFYLAETIFHPESGNRDNQGLSSISLLFEGSTAGNSNQFMFGVLRSRYLSEQVAADTVMYKGKQRLLSDLILEFKPKYTSIPSFLAKAAQSDKPQKSYIQKVVSAANDIRFSIELENTQEGFIRMNIFSYDSKLSGVISDSYIKQLTIYYGERKTEKAQRNVKFYSYRADSIKTELDNINKRIAYIADKNRYKIYAKDDLLPVDLESQQAILSNIYSALVISREQALAQLQEDIPVIQVLDPPKPPFKKIKSNWFLYLFAGSFIGFILASFLSTRKLIVEDLTAFIRSALKLDEEEDVDQAVVSE
ncbi:MAG: hypothetical protein AAFY71_26995 [Bacteroidota bacterium]